MVGELGFHSPIGFDDCFSDDQTLAFDVHNQRYDCFLHLDLTGLSLDSLVAWLLELFHVVALTCSTSPATPGNFGETSHAVTLVDLRILLGRHQISSYLRSNSRARITENSPPRDLTT